MQQVDAALDFKPGTLADHDVLGIISKAPQARVSLADFLNELLAEVCEGGMWDAEEVSDGRRTLTWRQVGRYIRFFQQIQKVERGNYEELLRALDAGLYPVSPRHTTLQLTECAARSMGIPARHAAQGRGPFRRWGRRAPQVQDVQFHGRSSEQSVQGRRAKGHKDHRRDTRAVVAPDGLVHFVLPAHHPLNGGCEYCIWGCCRGGLVRW